jgi:hypothetical protein
MNYTFKTGDRVTCKIEEVEIKDAKIYIDKENTNKAYICQNIKDGDISPDKLGYKYSWAILDLNYLKMNDISDLKHAVKDLYHLEAGDLIKCDDGSKAKILGVCGEVIFRSNTYDYSYFSEITTAKRLEEKCWQVVQDKEEEVKEMTVEEVSKLVGKKVKIVE